MGYPHSLDMVLDHVTEHPGADPAGIADGMRRHGVLPQWCAA